jgi:putative addiction module component (TIGR02574 family)
MRIKPMQLTPNSWFQSGGAAALASVRTTPGGAVRCLAQLIGHPLGCTATLRRFGEGSEPVWYLSRMADSASKLEAKALKLPPEERARLAQRLISSLDQASDPESEELWIRESERRLEELESGSVASVPAERVVEKARSSLR